MRQRPAWQNGSGRRSLDNGHETPARPTVGYPIAPATSAAQTTHPSAGGWSSYTACGVSVCSAVRNAAAMPARVVTPNLARMLAMWCSTVRGLR